MGKKPSLLEVQEAARRYLEREHGYHQPLQVFEALTTVEMPDKGAWELRIRMKPYSRPDERTVRLLVNSETAAIEAVHEETRTPPASERN